MFSFKQSLVIGAVCVALAAGTPAANAQVLDPAAYTSGGALSLSSGAYTLDTDALTFNGYSGVLSNGIAVFDFSSINVATGATVNVVGSHPLALLSQSDAIFGANSSFNLNGGAGGNGSNTHIVYPPAPTPGAAGAGGYIGGSDGSYYLLSGPGAGLGAGGGASFGGNGGDATGTGLHASLPYGNLLTKIEGGSGGSEGVLESGGGQGNYYGGGAGGGGGGAIEIGAKGTLALSGNLNVNGGAGGAGFGGGGGGAGGGVLLSGQSVQIAPTGSINAMGGNGGNVLNNRYLASGGGSGGRITIQTNDSNGFFSSGALNVTGGSGFLNYYVPIFHTEGQDGVITVNGRVTNTPAPGSLLVAVLGAVPVVAMLRRRRK